jgi:hypothetical protein
VLSSPDIATRLQLRVFHHQRTCIDCQLLEEHWMEGCNSWGGGGEHLWTPGACPVAQRMLAKLNEAVSRKRTGAN